MVGSLRLSAFGIGICVVTLAALLAPPIYALGDAGGDAGDDGAAAAEMAGADGGSEDAGEPAAATPGKPLEKLQIHGFLTQAFATADFLDGGFASPSANESALGISEDGTTDYRFLALQFRYEISPKDLVVIQLSSRALGFSPIDQVEDEIELDWAFYERRIGDHTSLKVGRVQIPIGIYNEIRDVGTILPFYRPPFTFYREGSFTSETVDGLALSHTFFPRSAWSLDADFYGGEWDQFEVAPDAPEAAAFARAEDAFGFQLWLQTPVQGLRFGFGGHRKKLSGGVFRPPGVKGETIEDWYVSVDASLSRFVFRSEYHEFDPTLNLPPAPPIFLTLSAWYAQLGYLATDKVQLWLQYEVAGVESDSAIQTRPEDRDDRTDLGFSFNYLFRPNLVLKLEYHEVEEEQSLLVPVPAPGGGFLLDPMLFEADDGSYTILSLSASF